MTGKNMRFQYYRSSNRIEKDRKEREVPVLVKGNKRTENNMRFQY